jgi:uncharacterized protein involved in outer membrane biogenesis
MKIFRRILLVLLLLVVIGAAWLYFHLDSLVKNTVETQSKASLKLDTTLSSARLALFGGKIDLNQLNIASPPGFTAAHMFELGKLGVAVSYGQLRNTPIRINQIVIKEPHFVLEQADGKMNFKAAMDSLPPSEPTTMKVIIDELIVSDALVDVRLGNLPGLGAMKPIEIKVPSLTLKNIGNANNAQNGAAMKDVVLQVATALAGKAGDSSNFPAQLKGILQANMTEVAGKLGGEFTKQLGGITQGLQTELNKIVPGVDINKIVPMKNIDPGKAIGDLLGGKKKDKKDDK